MDVKGILMEHARDVGKKSDAQIAKEVKAQIKANVGHGISRQYYDNNVVSEPHYRADNIRGCIANALKSAGAFDQMHW